MINLIPKEEQKRMRKNFYFRLLSVFFIMFGFSFIFGVFAMAPAYFLIYFKEDVINSSLLAQQNEKIPEVTLKALEDVKDLNNKLDILDRGEKNKFLISERVINEIILQKMPDIKINQIFYENTPAGGKKITIRGIAPSRERLLLFRLALENDTSFKKVDLPISNFVKGSNIQFFINLVPN